MAVFSLEAELKHRADEKHADAIDYRARFENIRSYLAANYYDWIQAKAPFLTNHGRLHIESVIQALDGLLSKSKAKKLSSLDIFLLLTAVLWHDVGNALGRIKHAERLPELTDKIRELGFPNPNIQRLVVEIAQAHSGREGLSRVRTEEDCSTAHDTYTVPVRALAALLRFADEISENRARISAPLMDLGQIPEANRIYWEYANCIDASRPDPSRNRVVLTINVEHQRAISRFLCPDYPSVLEKDGKTSLIEYILHRLEKMNNERAYAAPFFVQYATMDTIECRLTLHHGTNRDPKYELQFEIGNSGLSGISYYPNIEVAKQFFQKYSHWTPQSIEEAFK